MADLKPWITDAIVEILEESPEVSEWATGGIHVRRAPPMPQGNVDRRRDQYIVISDVVDSTPEHTQGGPAQITIDKLLVTVWAESSVQACNGAGIVRIALDGVAGTSARIVVQRIFWQGTTTREDEDASGAETLMNAADMEFEVGYTLPT